MNDFYVVTHSRTLTEKPDLVRRFLDALLTGWQEALDPKNENEALAILQKYDPDTPLVIQKQQLKITRELVQPQPSKPIGTIDEDAWAQTQQIMYRQKLLPQQIDLKEILKPIQASSVR